jgi:hypothetical protein
MFNFFFSGGHMKTAFTLLLLAFCALAQPVFMPGDTVAVMWDRPSESDIAYYTLYVYPLVPDVLPDTLRIENWSDDGLNYQSEPLQLELEALPDVDTPYSMTLTATDQSENESQESVPYKIILRMPDTTPPKRVSGVIMVLIGRVNE